MDQLIYLALLIVCSVVVLKRFGKHAQKPDETEQERPSDEE